jgi:protein-L-isoaspartate(D-aspartate) O-methyltransferase
MNCQDVMVAPVQCARLGEPIVAVARRMRDESLGFLPVCDASRRALGVVTDRDLAVRALAEGGIDLRVEDVMTPLVVSCFPEDGVDRALELMREHQTARVLVVSRRGVPLGVVSLSDLARVPGVQAGALLRDITGRAVREPSAALPDPRDGEERGMIDELTARGVTDPALLSALATVPRWRFLPDAGDDAIFGDVAVPLPPEPAVPERLDVARTVLALGLAPCDRVLVAGGGCAYTAAVLATLGADVVIVDSDAARAERTAETLDRLALEGSVLTGDPGAGLAARAPFDGILVCGDAPLTHELLSQLAVGGVLLSRNRDGDLVRLERLDEELYRRQILAE